jgi:hypothetical protein
MKRGHEIKQVYDVHDGSVSMNPYVKKSLMEFAPPTEFVFQLHCHEIIQGHRESTIVMLCASSTLIRATWCRVLRLATWMPSAISSALESSDNCNCPSAQDISDTPPSAKRKNSSGICVSETNDFVLCPACEHVNAFDSRISSNCSCNCPCGVVLNVN